MRAQASAEFLMVIALLAVAMLPLLLSLQANAVQTPDQLALSKAVFSASRLAASVESVGSLGLNSSLSTPLELPDVTLVNASGREVVIRVRTSYGPVDIVQATRYNVSSVGLDAIRREGSYVVNIRASENLSNSNVSLSLR